MAGKAIATVGSMHVCPLTTGTVPHVGGPISGPGIATALLDGQPVAVVGDMCTCCGPPDVILQGAATALIDGKPIALMGSMTAHGGQIVQGIPTATIGPADPPSPRKAIADLQENELLETEESTYEEAELEPPLFTGCVDNPLVEDIGNGGEESEEIKLASTTTWEDLNEFADEFKDDKEAFIYIIQLVYGESIETEAYSALHNKLLNREINPLEIEVVKNYVVNMVQYEPPLPLNYAAQEPEKPKILGFIPRKQAPVKKGENKIIVSEDTVKKASENNSTQALLNQKIEEAYEQYIAYLLQHEFSTGAATKENQEVAKTNNEKVYRTDEWD